MALPGMDRPKTRDEKATDYINSLYKTTMYKRHRGYFRGYLNADNPYGAILSHIRKAYIDYVLGDKWTADKFNEVLYVLVSNEQILSDQAFINMGILYDTGDLEELKGFADYNNELYHAQEVNGEEVVESNKDISDDELFKFLNGGA